MAYFFGAAGGGSEKDAIKKPVSDRPGYGLEMRSGPPDNAQYQRDQRQNNQNMDHTANAIYENAQKPSDQQDDCNQIQ
jgi:hypothetical protein